MSLDCHRIQLAVAHSAGFPSLLQVLMMGFGGTMSEWTPQFLRSLAQGREVVIFDYMAQGLSKVGGLDSSTHGDVAIVHLNPSS